MEDASTTSLNAKQSKDPPHNISTPMNDVQVPLPVPLYVASSPFVSLPVVPLPVVSPSVVPLPVVLSPVASLPVASLPVASLRVVLPSVASLPVASLPVVSSVMSPALPMALPVSFPTTLPYIAPIEERTPLRINHWKRLMALHPEADKVQYILDTLTHGADLNFLGERDNSVVHPNLKTATDKEDIVDTYVADELQLGRYLGPFDEPPCENFRSSPIGVIPKDITKFRLINHLSFPRQGDSINAGIGSMECGLGSYDEAVRLVTQVGPGAQLLKVDVKAAFRLIPVKKCDLHLIGIAWKGKYYLDLCLPFGLKTSPSIWERFSRMLRWILIQQTGISTITHYVDDFLLIAPMHCNGELLRARTLAIFATLGVPVSRNKLVGPTTRLTYLGLGIDTVEECSFVPEDKMSKAIAVMTEHLGKTHITKKELQSILGVLFFLTRVIPQGKAFLSRGVSLLKGKRMGSGRMRVTVGLQKDLQWWIRFLPVVTGVSLFYEQGWTTADTLSLYTDASGWGAGAFFGLKWFQHEWTQTEKALAMREKRHSMPHFELLALALALSTWRDELAGKHVELFSDCLPVVMGVNKWSSRSPGLMDVVRFRVMLCWEWRIVLRIKHIRSEANVLADPLSRNDLKLFQDRCPRANKKPDVVRDLDWTNL